MPRELLEDLLASGGDLACCLVERGDDARCVRDVLAVARPEPEGADERLDSTANGGIRKPELALHVAEVAPRSEEAFEHRHLLAAQPAEATDVEVALERRPTGPAMEPGDRELARTDGTGGNDVVRHGVGFVPRCVWRCYRIRTYGLSIPVFENMRRRSSIHHSGIARDSRRPSYATRGHPRARIHVMTRPNAADLLRSTGLMADGPVRWGRVVPAKGPGVYLVELADPLPNAPIDLSKVGKWLERVRGLRVDGERPTSKSLLARLASLWLSDATLLYAGASTASVGGRVASLQRHVLGDPRPHADGQWLLALRDLSSARIWWASTKAPEEYLDAIFEAFAAAGPAPARPASIGEPRPAAAILLPWANSRRPTGERQQHGITGSVLPLPVEAPTPPRR